MSESSSRSQQAADRLVAQDTAHVWHHIFPHRLLDEKEPLVIVSAEGLRVRDLRGREYLDATSGGVWCVNVGYGRRSIARAVAAQLEKMPYWAGVGGNVPAIELAEKITGLMPGMARVYYSSSGSEANEKAFKMVRQAAAMNGGGKYKILYRDRDYHGTTIAALAASGHPERREGYGPMPEGFAGFPHAFCYRCPFGRQYPGCELECARAVEDAIVAAGPDSVGAVLVEPITAGGGIIAPVAEYYPLVQEICRRHGVRLIFDEVVCGFGRTGKMFGYQHYEVQPDIVTLAKGLASAYLPISATVTRDDVFDIFLNAPERKMDYFRDISTYGGCAAACTAALESIRIVEEESLVENSRRIGAYLLERLRELLDLAPVGDVRGRGCFCGVELVADRSSREPADEGYVARVVADIASRGVLIGKSNRSLPGLNNTLFLAPALTINRDEADEIVAAIRGALETVTM